MARLNLTIMIPATIVIFLCLLILVITQRKLDIPPKYYYTLIIIALPFSTLINLFKIPILYSLFSSSLTQNSLSIYQITIWLLIVGVTEETIKIVPLFFPPINRKRNNTDLTIFGWCLGCGFGIGEIWFLVIEYSINYDDNNYHWINWLIGFGVERFLVVFAHAAFTIIALKGLEKNSWRFGCSISLAIFLHGLLNSPILLYSAGFISKIEMTIIFLMELIFVFIFAFYLLFVTVLSSGEVLNEHREIIKKTLLKRAEESTFKDT